jgi:hypothetical protein
MEIKNEGKRMLTGRNEPTVFHFPYLPGRSRKTGNGNGRNDKYEPFTHY